MPKRTNDWQALVYFVRRFLSEGSRVTESKMLLDRETGREVEVDICIEGSVGGDEVLLSVECTDRQRPATVGWVDEMDSKHQALPTNKLILASRSGFTKSAINKAAARNIVLVSLAEKPEDAAVRIERALEALWLKTIELRPTVCKIDIDANDAGVPAVRVVSEMDTMIFDQKDAAITSVGDFVMPQLRRTDLVVEQLDLAGRREDLDSPFIMDIQNPTAPQDGENVDLYLQHIATNSLQRINRIMVGGDARIRVAHLPLTHGQFEATNVAWGRGDLGGQDVLIVAVEDASGGGQVSMRFGNSVEHEREG